MVSTSASFKIRKRCYFRYHHPQMFQIRALKTLPYKPSDELARHYKQQTAWYPQKPTTTLLSSFKKYIIKFIVHWQLENNEKKVDFVTVSHKINYFIFYFILLFQATLSLKTKFCSKATLLHSKRGVLSLSSWTQGG